MDSNDVLGKCFVDIYLIFGQCSVLVVQLLLYAQYLLSYSASDSFQQRGMLSNNLPNIDGDSRSYVVLADLSRVCFDALLSLSRSADVPEHPSQADKIEQKSPNSLGFAAISSLLQRCKQVSSTRFDTQIAF